MRGGALAKVSVPKVAGAGDMRSAGALAQRRDSIAVIVLSAVTFWVYHVFGSLEQSGDSLSYAWSIKTGYGLSHPHHLIFSPVVRALHRALSSFGVSSDPLFAARLHNIMWACTAVAGVFLIVRTLAKSFALAVTLALLLAVCNGFWRFSTQAEVYVPATGCLTLLTYLMVRPSTNRWSVARLLTLCALLSLAVLYHQTSVLYVVPLLLAATMTRKRQELRGAVAAVVLAGLLVSIAYVVAYALDSAGPPTASGFVKFCLLYSNHPNPAWGTVANMTLEGVGRSLRAQLVDIVYLPEGRSLPVVLLVGLFGVALAVLGAAAIRASLREPPQRMVLVLALSWLGTYFLFNLWWLPGESEFYISTLVPLILLLALVLSRIRFESERGMDSPAGLAMAAVVLVLFGYNLKMAVWPSHCSKGPFYAAAEEIAAISPGKCMVMSGFRELQNLRYYFGTENSTETVLPLLYAYTRHAIPDPYRVRPGECVVALLPSLRPDYDIGGLSGLSHPEDWLFFMRELFELDDSSGVLLARSARFGGTCGGAPYVILSASKRGYQSWDAFFGCLDSLGANRASVDTVFRGWLRSNRRLVADNDR
jgi:hypothetical protein